MNNVIFYLDITRRETSDSKWNLPTSFWANRKPSPALACVLFVKKYFHMSQILGRKGLAFMALGASHAFAARRLLISEGASDLSPGTETAYIIVVVLLIIISGLAAGLTLGLLSLDRSVVLFS